MLPDAKEGRRMERIKTVHLVYFSGTGGTARVADSLKQAFLRRNVREGKTSLNRRVKQTPRAGGENLLVLLFPVYAFNAPEPVDEWILAAPEGRGMSAAIIAVSGGGEISPNTACRVRTVRKLEAKGYVVQYEGMFVLPSNYVIGYNDHVSAMLLRSVPGKAERTVLELMAGKRQRIKPFWLDHMFSALGLLEKRYGGRLFGKLLQADDTCTGCTKCAVQCPRDNIAMDNGKPVFGRECVMCLCCVYGCPRQSIAPSWGRFIIVPGGYDLKALECRTRGIQEFPPCRRRLKASC